MNNIPLIAIILMICTLATLVLGLLAMACGGKINQKYSNKLMRLRVVLQMVSIGLVAVLCVSYASSH